MALLEKGMVYDYLDELTLKVNKDKQLIYLGVSDNNLLVFVEIDRKVWPVHGITKQFAEGRAIEQVEIKIESKRLKIHEVPKDILLTQAYVYLDGENNPETVTLGDEVISKIMNYINKRRPGLYIVPNCEAEIELY